MKENADLG